MKKLFAFILLFVSCSALANWYITKSDAAKQCSITGVATVKPKSGAFDTYTTNTTFKTALNSILGVCTVADKVITPPPVVVPVCVAPQVLDVASNKCVTPIVPPPVVTPPISLNYLAPPPSALQCAEQGKICHIPTAITAKIWFGTSHTHWVTKHGMKGDFTCDGDTLGNQFPNDYRRCFWIDENKLIATLDPKGQNLIPSYNPALIPAPKVGEGVLKIRAATIPPSRRDNPNAGGEFRIGCDFAKMAPDDPIVYPGVPGASHLHTFFGNVSADAYSTNDTLRAAGNSTCAGGIANRSGYWIPTLINMSTGAPVKPIDTVTYYKSQGWRDAENMTAPPKGLRMIAGNAKPLSIADANGYMFCQDRRYVNNAPDYGIVWQGNHLESCGGPDQRLRLSVSFPTCWDGKNLDSPDHKSHMAHYCKDECEDASGNVVATPNGCPASHPIAIPGVTINADFADLDQNAKYRLASDNYDPNLPGGYSLHGDWMNGWDEAIMQRIIDNCMKKHMDCGGPNLGDGQELYGFYND